MSDSAAALLSTFLLGHKIDQAVVNYILADTALGLGCESLSDFAGYFTAEECDSRGSILAHVDKLKESTNASKIRLWGSGDHVEVRGGLCLPP
jgi:hypothetical protein